jgi:hypothetical protein
MKKIFNYLNLRDVGFLELTFTLTPMLSGFGLGGLPLSLLMWVVLLIIVALQGRLSRAKVFNPLLFFVLYWFVHTVVIMLVDDVNINGIIEQIIFFMSVFFLYPIIDFHKLRGCLNWVALIAIMGLLYQWFDIVRGVGVHPLEIPGLSMAQARLDVLLFRPSSFFMEPAAYVAFMICPLALSLIEKKYLWAIALILSIFLTTSTTGLVLSFVLLGASLFIQKKIKIKTSLGLLIIGGGLFFALTHFDVFEAGVEKVENTDASTNVRLSQGPHIVSTMYPSEWLFGAFYGTVYSYCKSGRAPMVEYYGESVYMSTFWMMILLYGVIGLVLYLNIYYKLFKSSKATWPLLACLFATLFSSGYGISGTYVFTLILLLVVARNDKYISNYNT